MINVLLVESHTLVRHGIHLILSREEDISIIGETGSGCETIRMSQQLHPDIIVMDLSLAHRMNGFDVINELRRRCPNIEIIILTMYDEEAIVQRAIRLGVKGYILKKSHPEELIEAIRNVYQGEPYYATSFTQQMIQKWFRTKSWHMESILTDREILIVRLTVLGYSNR